MMNPDLVINHKFAETTYTYTERDVALYALGIGACTRDALDDKELKYLYHEEKQQSIQVFPTFAAIISTNGLMSRLGELPGFTFDPQLLLHGQHYIKIYKPLPSNCSIQNKARIVGLHDKGKATIIEIEVLSYEKQSGSPFCMNRTAYYLRGAGGFSKSSQPYSFSKYPKNQTASKVPKTQPFAVYEECTQPSQALLYRLSSDYNPLHSDPMTAQVAGFSRPILHGLCTLGFAVRSVIRSICKGDANLVKAISGRFLLHVYPGETLITEMWLEGLSVLYQVKVKERNKAVLAGFVDLTRLSSSL